ncbi:DoxX family membrane protein [Nocardioides sp. LS1]|uniref:DoxX family membrane protein n=1 Tax=Nocardioides sp. LS1 TaxID=1027620 RepID=UPI000F62849E|nr:DoxX family membrane protein [Nocardioides sp. LS1]GCD88279.1 hypothetical protein NLS1_02850 [Nocardioides sp. LS1]
MTVTRLIARPLLASAFFVGAVSALKNAQALGPKAAPVTEKIVPLAHKAVPQLPIPEDPVTLVRINAAIQLGAAAALATGKAPRTASTVLLASLAPTTFAGHPFWKEKDKAARKAQELHFFKNLSMVGGLILAGVDTEGKPGVAWRTRRAAKDARREAKHLAATARREAKLVAAQVH